MRWTAGVLIFAFLGAHPTLVTHACDKDDPKASIHDVTLEMTKRAGFLPLYTSSSTGRIYLEILDGGGPDLLYQPILASGFGLKNLSLDRGYLGS